MQTERRILTARNMCSCVVDAEIPRKHARALPSSIGHLSPVFCTRSIIYASRTPSPCSGVWEIELLKKFKSLTTIAKFMSSSICYNELHGLLLTFWSPDFMQNKELSAHWTYKWWKDTDVLVLTSKFLRQWPYNNTIWSMRQTISWSCSRLPFK